MAMARHSVAALALLSAVNMASAMPARFAIGLAEGFISDGNDLETCGIGAISEIGNIKQGVKTLEHGVTHLNLTEVEHGVQDVKAAIASVPGIKQQCHLVETDLESIVTSLKTIHGPKDLVLRVITNLFDDADKIFGELAAAEHAYKTGWDFVTAGQQAGMALRRMLVGERGHAPQPAPPTKAEEKALFEGMATGFISDSFLFKDCESDLKNESQDFHAALTDLEDGIRHVNVSSIKEAVEKIEAMVKGAAGTEGTCKAELADAKASTKAILSALKDIHGPKALIIKVVNNLFEDGEKIFGELSAADSAMKAKDYSTSGRQLGMALRRSLVGEVKSLKLSTVLV